MSWKSHGSCVPYGPRLWYSDKPTDQDVARQICAECPVKSACLEHALVNEPFGMWAGTSERERRRLRRQRRLAG